jgi:thioredoxin 1
MKKKRTSGWILILSLTLVMAEIAFPQSKATTTESKDTAQPKKPLVTFVELGSVKCIPCRQMQPVMAAIEKKYGEQIKVVFYDVWKPEQEQYAEQYTIKLIPTQVFLDKDGKEFFRHEGFYPEAEIDKLLQKRGLKMRAGV